MEIKLGQRKLYKVNYSHTVTLPKIWVDNAGLKENDFVEFTMLEDGSLLVQAVKTDEMNSVWVE